MNTTHLHLLLNHFPVIGTLMGSCLLLWGIIKKQNNVKSIAAAALAILALIAIPVYLTGEPAEESVENMPGVSKSMIELHEDAATIAIWVMGFTGITSLVALFFAWQKNKLANTIFLIVLAFSTLCFAAMARTGYYGGQIRHSEIGNGNANNQQNNNEPGKAAGNNLSEEEDD